MKNYLAIDTSSKHLTVIACKNGVKEVHFLPDCALHHSVRLMGCIESAMEALSLTPADCDFFCAVTGPGSFTGIRIGISAAKGLAIGLGKPLMPLTAFEMVAYNVNGVDDFGVAVDAAHGHYYFMRFTRGETGEAQYLSKEEVISLNLPLYGYEALSLPQYTAFSAEKALECAVARKMDTLSPYGGMTALYVRKSQAEEGRK